MAELDYDALQRLADAATPGPWEAGDVWVYTDPVYPDDRRLSNVLGMEFADPKRADAERERGLRNAEFIAAARSAVPALLARVRELEHTVGDYEIAAKLGEASARTELIRKAGIMRERDAALSSIAKVRELHRRLNVVDDETDERIGETCEVCGEIEGYEVTWPCPTIRALGSVPSTGEGNE